METTTILSAAIIITTIAYIFVAMSVKDLRKRVDALEDNTRGDNG